MVRKFCKNRKSNKNVSWYLKILSIKDIARIARVKKNLKNSGLKEKRPRRAPPESLKFRKNRKSNRTFLLSKKTE